ncbi:MAG: amino acid racemase, partial [Planctomycetes bacterium]|nr:amino acid racemase [Planctomycetota bacterium]
MAKHIGIVACSAEGAALCYRTICAEAPRRMGPHCHPEITMHTHPLSEYMVHIRAGDWRAVADLMLSSANKVAGAGAEFALCPDNTIHQAFELVEGASPIPWLHIAGAVAREARRMKVRRLAVLGTKYLMTGPVYPTMLEKFSISMEIPDQHDRERIDGIIFDELVYGVFREESRLYFNEVIAKLKDKGCGAAVLGCTE